MATIPTEGAVLTLVDRIYGAVEQADEWPEIVNAIGSLVGGRPDFWYSDGNAQNLRANPSVSEAGCHGTLFLSRADLRDLDDYAHEYGELITRFLKIIFLSTLTSQINIGAREVIGLRMTKRYLNAFESSSENSQSPAARFAARNFIAALWEDGRTFSHDSLRLMRLLMPHLDRALRLQMRLNTDALRADMVSGALDHLTLGVVLVDRSGLPFWHNRRAREIMHCSNALRLSSIGIVGRNASQTRSLRELIETAVFAGTQSMLAIDRGDQFRSLLLIASPLKPLGLGDTIDSNNHAPGGVVFISDPERDDEPTVQSLQKAFNLTTREAQLAIAVSRGHGLNAAAETMGIAATTARTQLQQAFAKTGTNHQAELAALVHRTLTQLRDI